jgi:TP901 family phage tail tape measure protein
MADEIILRLRGDSAELVRAAEAAKTAIHGVGVSVDQLGNKVVPGKLTAQLDQIGSSMTAIGTRAMGLVTLPIVAAIGGAIKVSADFEQAFANVKKTLNGTPEQLAEIRAGIIDLSRTLPQSTEELANMAALGGQFGISAGGILEFTKTVAALDAAVDGLTAEQAAEGLAQLRNITGEAEKDIGKLASTLVHLGNNGASSEAQILDFSQRLAGAGKIAGLQTSEIMALGASMANLGINAEAGGTAMSRTLTRMSDAVEDGGDKLRAFANIADMTSADFAAKFRAEPIKAVEEFISGLGRTKTEGAGLNDQLRSLGVEAMREADALKRLALATSNNTDEQAKLSHQVKLAAQAFEDGDKHLKEAAEKNKTLYRQIDLVVNAVKNAIRPIGDDLVEALAGATSAVIPAIEGIGKLLEYFTLLPDTVKLAFVGSLGVAAIAPILIVMTGQVITAAAEIMKLRNAMRGLAAADAIGGVTGALGGGVTKAGLIGALSTLGTVIGVGAAAGGILYGLYKIDGAARGLGEAFRSGTGYVDGFRKSLEFLGKREETWASRTVSNLTGGAFGFEATPTPAPNAGLGIFAPDKPRVTSGADAEAVMARAAERATQQANRAAAEAGNFQGAGFQAAQERLALYNAELKEFGKRTFEAAAREHELGLSTKDAAAQFGIAEQSLDRYIALQKEGAKAAKGRAAEEKKGTKEAQDLLERYYKNVAKEEKKAAQEKADLARVMKEGERALWKWRLDTAEDYLADMTAVEIDRLEERRDITRQQLLALEELERDSLAKRERIVRREFEDRRQSLDKHSAYYEENLAKINAMEAAALKETGRLWDIEVKQRIHDTLRDVAGGIRFMAGMFEQVGKDGKRTFAGWVTDLADIGESVIDISEAIAKKDVMGTIMGVIKLGKQLFDLFRDEEWEKVNDARDEFFSRFGKAGLQADGAFHTLARRLHALGPAGDELFNRVINARRMEDFEAAVADVNEVLGELDAQFAEMIGAAQGTGQTLDKALLPYIDQLEKAGFLTRENAAALRLMATDNAATSEQMRSAAEALGIELSELGQTFQQQRLNETAEGVIKNFKLLVDNGTDFNVVLRGATDEINAIVQDSLQFGTTIPANMQPWIEKLIESGELVDANGEKITDINSLSFGDAIKVGLDDVVAKLQEMIDLMTGGVDRAVGGVGSRLNDQRSVWDRWADHAKAKAREVQDEVDAVSLGHSPGGLKEIPLQLARGEASMQSFRSTAVKEMRTVESAVNALGDTTVKTPVVEGLDNMGAHFSPGLRTEEEAQAKKAAMLQEFESQRAEMKDYLDRMLGEIRSIAEMPTINLGAGALTTHVQTYTLGDMQDFERKIALGQMRQITGDPDLLRSFEGLVQKVKKDPAA